MRVIVKIKPKKTKDSKMVAKAAIFTQDGSVLLLKRSGYVKKHKGEWDLPGGHVHKGEDLEAGLMREVKEETNLLLSDSQFVFKNDYFYAGESKFSEIRLSEEHTSFIFCEVSKLDDLSGLTSYYKNAILKCYRALEDE